MLETSEWMKGRMNIWWGHPFCQSNRILTGTSRFYVIFNTNNICIYRSKPIFKAQASLQIMYYLFRLTSVVIGEHLLFFSPPLYFTNKPDLLITNEVNSFLYETGSTDAKGNYTKFWRINKSLEVHSSPNCIMHNISETQSHLSMGGIPPSSPRSSVCYQSWLPINKQPFIVLLLP